MFDLNVSASPALTERLRLFAIDDASVALLADSADRILGHLPAILNEFYDHLWQQPAARAILGSPDRFDTLKTKQRGHWAQLLSGRFDQAYYESARAIGMAHCRIGLDPSIYIGGYSFVLNKLMVMVGADLGPSAHDVLGVAGKALMLDMDLALSIYAEATAEGKKAEFASLATQLDGQVQMVASTLVEQSASVKQSASELLEAMQGVSQGATAVAAASEQASVNVGTVAAATEELSASVREIGRQAVQSRDISDRAVTEADRATAAIDGLSTTAREIGNVLKLISDIASQTNLLALNATIEAARAGDAGRGFAVVASEVKSLANETARATGTISNQITAIQDAAKNTADVIGGIQAVIADMKANATAIADAVEEQMVATGEISQNIQEASAGTQQVTSEIYRISDQARVADNLAGDLAGVAAETEETAVGLQTRVHEVILRMETAQT